MIEQGVYPASVTPFDANGHPDAVQMVKLLARYEAHGCQGAVIAGTNGEGPSLSAVEKRDLVRDTAPHRGRLRVILGIATPSLSEAIWSAKQAEKSHVDGLLVMPPYYFKTASEDGLVDWFRAFLDSVETPVLVYNHPKACGVPITPDLLRRLSDHANFAGAKDSSGQPENLARFRESIPGDKRLFVGDETLLLDALKAGWSGTISGASNVLSLPICAVVQDWFAGKRESAETKFALLKPMIETIRKLPQPASHKRALCEIGAISSPEVRAPLTTATVDSVVEVLSWPEVRA